MGGRLSDKAIGIIDRRPVPVYFSSYIFLFASRPSRRSIIDIAIRKLLNFTGRNMLRRGEGGLEITIVSRIKV